MFISTLGTAFAVGQDDKIRTGECLSGPKGAAPLGERWRYRVERNTKRHCWYTRADGQSKAVAQRAPAKPIKDSDPQDTPPLRLSVANARAEADLSALPPAAEPGDVQTVAETRNPAWTLAERWSQNSDPSPDVQAQPAPIKQAVTVAPAEPPEIEQHDSMLEMAAGTLALLGLSVVLIATLMRRRKHDSLVRNWPLVRHDADDEPDAPLTDLNDEPLMTWRKASKERLQIMRRSAELRDATNLRLTKPNPAGSAGLRRTPTIPPGARA